MGSRLHDCFFICVTQVFHGLRKCYHISQVEHSLNMLNMFAWFLVGITSDEEVVIYLRYVKPLGKSVKRRNPLLNKIRDESTGEWRCTWFMEQKLCIFGPEQMNVWFCDMFRSLGALSFWGCFFPMNFPFPILNLQKFSGQNVNSANSAQRLVGPPFPLPMTMAASPKSKAPLVTIPGLVSSEPWFAKYPNIWVFPKIGVPQMNGL